METKGNKRRTTKGETQEPEIVSTKSKKTAGGKMPILKYVKGKLNPNVKVREHMD